MNSEYKIESMEYSGMYSFQYRSRDYGAVDVTLKPRTGQRFQIDLVGEISYVVSFILGYSVTISFQW